MSCSPLPRKLTKYVVGVLAFFITFHLLSRSLFPPEVKIQHKFPKRSFLQSDRRNAVTAEFLHAWTGYQDHGWMADGLHPVTGGKQTKFCSWSATLVDALDTLWIMGLTEDAGDCSVNLFESTIRYLGGLLGAYDLSSEPKLFPKLVEVGDMLYSAFNTSNGMPCSSCHLASKEEDEMFAPCTLVSMADVGSLYLEFGRLSQITAQPKYYQAANSLAHVFVRTQNDSSIPGLWPEMVDASSVDEDARFAKKYFSYSLGANSDSSYEYLLKGHMLMGGITRVYNDMWIAAAKAIRSSLLFRGFIPQASEIDILFSGIATRYEGAEETLLEPSTQHLTCFAGGMFAIASKVFREPNDLEIGKALTQGCVWAYNATATGIMPETLSLLPCPDLDGSQCEWNQTLWDLEVPRSQCLSGYACDNSASWPDGYIGVSDARYILRPEAIESVFTMWRITGDEYWRDVGWEMWEAIIRHTRTPFGHSALTSVMETQLTPVVKQGVLVARPRARQSDDMESFWFVETLKYFYLLFSDVDLIDLNEFVLNTEAHPLRLMEGIRGF